VLLAKSIRHIESNGDYNAVGDQGQSHGAYQFNKDNYKNWATQYGVDSNDMSPINQDKVAYSRINDLLQKGLKPSEVAAIWNGAKKTSSGYQAINPAYVEKVKAEYANQYNNYSGGQSSGNFVDPSQTQSTEHNFVTPPDATPPTTSADAAANPSQQKPGFIQSLIQGAANPFIQLGRLPVGYAEQGIGALTGNKGLQEQGQAAASNQPLNAGYFGTVNAAGYDANGKPLSFGGATEQAVGAGLQLAPYALGGGEVADVAGNAASRTIGGLIKTGAQVGATGGGLTGVGNALQQGAEQHQDAATTAGNALIQGGEGVIGGGITGGVLGGAGGLIGKGLGKIGGDVPIQDAIDAINPNSKGAKLSSEYAKGAFNGKVNPAGMFSGQSVSPNAEIVRLGKSLSDVGLKSAPSEAANNLVKLNSALTQTEAKLNKFKDFGVSPGIKNVVIHDLDQLKTQVPAEFTELKNQSPAFNKVIEYAKGIVGKSNDTIGGYRSARSDFYDSLKTQFPSSFDDMGRFNPKTPQGAAGKMVYDALGKNLSDIAPTNSGYQDLIKREADIFTAAKNIAPKAQKFDGMNKFQRLLKGHPNIVKGLTTAAEIAGLGTAAGLIGHAVGNSSQQ
jgi:hypothetical protein